jgi:hypothetical protein
MNQDVIRRVPRTRRCAPAASRATSLLKAHVSEVVPTTGDRASNWYTARCNKSKSSSENVMAVWKCEDSHAL